MTQNAEKVEDHCHRYEDEPKAKSEKKHGKRRIDGKKEG